MSAKYWRISPRIWLKHHWTEDMKFLALYLLTCEHRTTEGIFRLPKAYICGDLGWDMGRIEEAFSGLIKEGFIAYDDQAQVVLLKKALKWQRPETSNHMKAAVKALSELPETHLFAEFLAICKDLAPSFYEYITRAMPDAISNAMNDAIDDDMMDEIGNTPSSILHSPNDDDNARAREGEEWRRLVAAIYGTPDAHAANELESYVEDLGESVVIEAMRRTVDAKPVAPRRYFTEICNRWVAKQVRSLDDVHRLDEAFEAVKRKNHLRKAPPPTDDEPSQVDHVLRSLKRQLSEMGVT